MSKRIGLIAVSAALVVSVIIGALIMLKLGDPERTPISDGTTPAEGSKSDDTQETESGSDGDTAVPEILPTPIVEIEDGYEIYFDQDVIAVLTDMEQKGEEDEVNQILDWIILLINRFGGNGYSPLAIQQVQRFYFIFRDEIMQEEFETVCGKLEQCIPVDGAEQSGFALTVEAVFGWENGKNYTYVFRTEAIE